MKSSMNWSRHSRGDMDAVGSDNEKLSEVIRPKTEVVLKGILFWIDKSSHYANEVYFRNRLINRRTDQVG